jgi:hypothetical protein
LPLPSLTESNFFHRVNTRAEGGGERNYQFPALREKREASHGGTSKGEKSCRKIFRTGRKIIEIYIEKFGCSVLGWSEAFQCEENGKQSNETEARAGDDEEIFSVFLRLSQAFPLHPGVLMYSPA